MSSRSGRSEAARSRSWRTKSSGNLPDDVYLSWDIDGLDPTLCPGTGTPVPGGLSWNEAVGLLRALRRAKKRIVGLDLCEVAPGETEWDANVGARLLYKMIGFALLLVLSAVSAGGISAAPAVPPPANSAACFAARAQNSQLARSVGPARLARRRWINLRRSVVQQTIRQSDAPSADRRDDSRHVHVAGLDDHRHFARRRSRDCRSGDEHAGHVRLHRVGIVNRLARGARELDAEHFEKRRVLPISGHEQHEVGRDFLFGGKQHRPAANLDHRCARQESHFVVANQRAHFRQQPELDDLRIEIVAAITDRHVGAGALAAHGRFDRRVAPADDQQSLAEVRVRIAEVVADVRQVLAGTLRRRGACIAPIASTTLSTR